MRTTSISGLLHALLLGIKPAKSSYMPRPESSWWPLSVWDDAQWSEPHRPGQNQLDLMFHHHGRRVSLLARSHSGFLGPGTCCCFLCIGVRLLERSDSSSSVFAAGADNFSHSCPLDDKIIFSKHHVMSSHYFLDFLPQWRIEKEYIHFKDTT